MNLLNADMDLETNRNLPQTPEDDIMEEIIKEMGLDTKSILAQK